MRVVLETTHLAPVGGGENYLMRFAMALEKFADEFYVVRNWPDKFIENNGFGKKFKEYSGFFIPDIYIFSSHFGTSQPIGKRNFIISLFPKFNLKPEGFDGIVSICSFTADWVDKYWNRPSFIIEPCIDPTLYKVGTKEKKIVSIGHFFEESDGHSKNQHVLAEAFGLSDEGYELVFIGNASDGDGAYVAKVRKAIGGKRIRVETNKNDTFIKTELSGASHLWHANGYQRSDPGQTEHFGIVAIEAIASGVIPIVHRSGGCCEIVGVNSWSRPDELNGLTRTLQDVPRLDVRYTVNYFEKRVGEWLDGILTSDVEMTTENLPKK